MKAAGPALLPALIWAGAAAAQPAPTNAASPPAYPPPAPYAAPPQAPAPSRLDQTGVAPDGPQSYSDAAWDARIRASVAAAQDLQGPMDGRWTLYDGEGRGLFVFQFVDPAGGRGPLEGVWRDLRRPPGSLAYGMVLSLQRDGGSLTAAFVPRTPGPMVSLKLQSLTDGHWSGEMIENGARVPVTLRRN